MEDTDGLLLGMLLGYIDQHQTLLDVCDFEVDIATRRRWIHHITDTIQKLHAAGVILGESKAENILVDKDDNISIIDFGWSYTRGWVDPEKAGTEEGDLQGLGRITELLEKEWD